MLKQHSKMTFLHVQNSLAHLKGESRTWALFFQVSQSTITGCWCWHFTKSVGMKAKPLFQSTLAGHLVFTTKAANSHSHSLSYSQQAKEFGNFFHLLLHCHELSSKPGAESHCKDLFFFYLYFCPSPHKASNWSMQDNEGTKFGNNSPPSYSVLVHFL